MPKTRFYLQTDPIGIQKGKNHLYAYAKGNPLIFVDPKGLLIAMGCNSGDEQRIKNAEPELAKSAECLPCEMRDSYQKVLETTVVWCQYNPQYVGLPDNDSDCGCSDGESITIFKPGPDEVPECSCLNKTIFHELLHVVDFSMSHKDIQRYENCAACPK